MFSFFLILSHSWWGEPHLAIAYLAESMISADQLQYINDILSTWNSEKAVFHDVANWHDDLKPIGMPLMVPWHFRNQPVFESGFTSDTFPITYNVTDVTRECIDTVLNTSTTNLWALNFCFRSLAHFVGDQHCPVHAAGYWSSDYPEGDRGGVSQKNVCDQYKYGSDVCRNLHMMWDSACLNYQTYPIPDSLQSEFVKNYTSLWTTYPPKTVFGSLADSLDPSVWETDAYNTARDYVYGKMPADKQLTDEYLAQGQPAAMKLISVGGHRLGLVLQEFFKSRGDNLPVITESKSIASEVVAWIIDAILLIVVVAYTILGFVSSTGGYSFSPLVDQ